MTDELPTAVCNACDAPNAPDADLCQDCGAMLKPGWLCWACGGFNHPSQREACAACGRLADSPAGNAKWRDQKVAGAALLLLVGLACAWSFVADLAARRNLLSTKDGEFSRRLREPQGDRVAAP